MRLGSPRSGTWLARASNVIALVVAIVAAVGVLLLPSYTSISRDATGRTTTSQYSLSSGEGPWALVVVAVPVLLVAIPLLLRNEAAAQRARIAVVVLLTICVMAGAASFGMFFIPTLVLMAMALVAAASAEGNEPIPQLNGDARQSRAEGRRPATRVARR